MKNVYLLSICGLLTGLAFACTPKIIERPPPSPLVKILTDSTLWGQQYPAALAYLDSWNVIGESTVAFFPKGVLGAMPYETPEVAEQKARDLAQAMQAAQPQPNADFEDLLRDAQSRPAPFQAEAIIVPDDSSTQIAWTGPSVAFLASELDLDRVQQRFGNPEEVTQQMLYGEKGVRPVTLTLYHYAGGAVIFAESDWGPWPGAVDRVLFDVPALTRSIFR